MGRIAPTVKHTGQESGGKLCVNFQILIVNNTVKICNHFQQRASASAGTSSSWPPTPGPHCDPPLLRRLTNKPWSHAKNQVNLTYFVGQNRQPKKVGVSRHFQAISWASQHMGWWFSYFADKQKRTQRQLKRWTLKRPSVYGVEKWQTWRLLTSLGCLRIKKFQSFDLDLPARPCTTLQGARFQIPL